MKAPALSQGRLASATLITITALGCALRVWEIGSKGLWLDEAFSVWLGWQPLGDLLGWLVKIDQHPPLYYALLHLGIKLAGDGPHDVRMLSALIGVLTIPVIFFMGRRLMDVRAGLIAALILALSPFHVRFAQEARMYTLLALNVGLALLALAYLLTDERATSTPIGRQCVYFCRSWRATRRRPPLATLTTDLAWASYTFFTAAALWSHNTAIFFPLAANGLVLGLIWMKSRGQLRIGDLRPPARRSWLSGPDRRLPALESVAAGLYPAVGRGVSGVLDRAARGANSADDGQDLPQRDVPGPRQLDQPDLDRLRADRPAGWRATPPDHRPGSHSWRSSSSHPLQGSG